MLSLKNQQLPRLGLLTCHDSKQAEDSKQGPPDGGGYYLGPPTVFVSILTLVIGSFKALRAQKDCTLFFFLAAIGMGIIINAVAFDPRHQTPLDHAP